MKPSTKMWILFSFLFSICVCSILIENGRIKADNATEFYDEIPKDILENRIILKSDNEFEFYRTDSEEMNCDYVGNYIAVHDLKDDFYLYLPDSYEIILDIKAEESGIVITYANRPDYSIRKVEVPICFPARMEGLMETTWSRYDEKSRWSWSDRRVVWSGEEVLEDTLPALPQKVWQIEILMGNKTCEIMFERFSPIYRRLFYEAGDGYRADYRFTIRDEDGGIICEQMFMDFPVQFEETYWIADFSGDGFADIAFCTALNYGTSYSNTYFCTLIWNVQKNCYEKKDLPEAEADSYFTSGYPLWNEDLHVLMVIVGTDKWKSAIYEMYSFRNGEWVRIRRLETAYSETEFYEMPGEEELYPEVIGYWELFYTDGKEKGKNFIEHAFREDSVWSKNNKKNWKLYPDYPEWENVSEIIGGIQLDKNVRK